MNLVVNRKRNLDFFNIKPKSELTTDRTIEILNNLLTLLFPDNDPEISNLTKPWFAMKQVEYGYVDCEQFDLDASRWDIITALHLVTDTLQERKFVTKLILTITGYKDIVDLKDDINMTCDRIYDTLITGIEILELTKEIKNDM